MTLKNFKFFRRPFPFGFLGITFLNLLLFGDLFWTGNNQVLSSSQADLYLHFVAWREFAFSQLRQGHLVLWNPYYLCGAPFLGGFEAGLLYPPNWLYLILPLSPAINLGIVLHVILAGFFTYGWALRRGLHPIAALMTGTIFMWGGAYYLHLFAGHLPNLCAMAWAPLIFLCIDGLAGGLSKKWMLLGIFGISMQILAGHPQYVYFTAIIVLLYAFLVVNETKSKWQFLLSVAGIYAGASAVTAAQLWTGLDAFSECARNIALETRSAGSFSFPPENILTMFFPDLFGSLMAGHYWGRWYLWEVSLFAGVVASSLTVFAVKEVDLRKTRWILVLGAVAFIFSLGESTPIYGLLYSFAPFFKNIRGICKFDFIVLLSVAMLAGTGLDFLIRSKKMPTWMLFFTLLSGFFSIGGGIFILRSVQNGPLGYWAQWFTSVHWLAKTVGLMGVDQRESYLVEAGLQAARSLWIGGGTFLLLAFILWLRSGKQSLNYLLAALCVLELFLFARTNRPTFDLAPLEKKFDALRDFYSKNPGDYRVYGTASASLVTGGHDIWEDEPMVLGRYGRFVCFSQGLSENQLFSVSPIYQQFPPALGMLRLKYRIFLDEEPIRIAPFPFKTIPRMILVDRWEVVSEGSQILPALFDPKFDPSQKIYLERDPGLVPTDGKLIGTVEWKDLSTEKVLVRAKTSKDSVLLITDNYSRDWCAEDMLDDRLSHYQVMPGNYFLTAIPLKAGDHNFYLEYRPKSFEIGKWVSILSCLLYVAILLTPFGTISIFRRK